MKTAKKALLLSLCAIMLVAATIMGTMAYLTSAPDAVVNTFTVGKLAITLDEADTDEYGVILKGEDGNPLPRVKGNEYKLVPGHRYVKDPTVHVQPNSEASYVFVVVDNGLKPVIDSNQIGAPENFISNIEEQIRVGTPDSHEWDFFYTAVNGKMVAVHWKAVKATGAEETIDLPVFDYFQLRNDINNATIDRAAQEKITITAYACQQDGFGSAEEAWNATFGATK